jgi:beta-lactamase class D
MSRWLRCALLALGPISAAGAAPLCTVYADGTSGRILSQQGDCARRFTPASTFKLALSLIGYDSGYLTDEHHPALPYRPSYPAIDPSWKTTIDPTSWISQSVVWYSQQLTLWLGAERLKRYLNRFDYGNQDISGNPGMNDGLTQAWLDSSLRISPLEQVAFVHRLVTHQLGLSEKAYEMTARITAVPEFGGPWQVHAKSGTGFEMFPDGAGPDLKRQIGWYVGWASHGAHSVVFACLISDDAPQDVRAGRRAKAALLAELPQVLKTQPLK